MKIRTSLFVSLAIFFVLPIATHAQGIPFFGPIIPNEQITINGVVGNQNVCAAGWGMLMIVINRIIALLLTLAIMFVAPLTIAYAGFLYVVNPVDPSGIAKAKKILWNTIVGIVIALAGWMIVDALMAVLYNKGATDLAGKTWSELITGDTNNLCIPLQSSLQQAGQTGIPEPGLGVAPAAGCAASYAVLPGINVSSSGNCCDRNNGTCTSLEGMSPATLSQISNIQNKCGAVTITGGTEIGHSGEGTVGSHSGGSKVDIGQNLVSCITGTTGRILVSSPSFGSAQVKDRCGNIYTWEGNHTDIYVTQACSL